MRGISICAECGTENPAKAKYCKNCGSKLEKEEPKEKRRIGWPIKDLDARKNKIIQVLKESNKPLAERDIIVILGLEGESDKRSLIKSAINVLLKEDKISRKKLKRNVNYSNKTMTTERIWHYQLNQENVSEKEKSIQEISRGKVIKTTPPDKKKDKKSKSKWPLQDLETRKKKIVNLLKESNKPLALRDFVEKANLKSKGKGQSRINSALTGLLRESILTRKKLPRKIEYADGNTRTEKVWHYQLKQEKTGQMEKKKPKWPLQDVDIRKKNIISILRESDKPLSIQDFRELVGVERGSKRSKRINSALYSLYSQNNILERKKLPKKIENGRGGTTTKKVWHYKLKKVIFGGEGDGKEYFEELGIEPKKVKETEKEKVAKSKEVEKIEGKDKTQLKKTADKYLPSRWKSSPARKNHILEVICKYLELPTSLGTKERELQARKSTARKEEVDQRTIADAYTRQIYPRDEENKTEKFRKALEKIEAGLK